MRILQIIFQQLGDLRCPQVKWFSFLLCALVADAFFPLLKFLPGAILLNRLQYGIIILLCLLLILSLMRRSPCGLPPMRARIMIVFALGIFCMIAFSTIIHGGDRRSVVQSCMYFLMFIFVTYFSGRHICISGLTRFLLISYYFICFVMFVTKGIDISYVKIDNFSVRDIDELRMTTTVAYLFKQRLLVGLYLFALGFSRDRTLSLYQRILCLFAIVPFLYFNVAIFKFRGSAFVVGVCVALIVLHALRQVNFKALAVSCLGVFLAIIVLFETDIFQGFRERVDAANAGYEARNNGGMLENERLGEVKYLFWDMKFSEYFIGKGFGGCYDAAEIYGELMGAQRRGTHLGIFTALLIGGWPLFIYIILSYLVPTLTNIRRDLPYSDTLYACRIFVITMFVRNIFNPMPFETPNYEDVILFLALGTLWAVKKGRLPLLDCRIGINELQWRR